MPLSWNEIRTNALAFSREWASATRENADAKSFWDEFFAVFGLKRRLVASFEEPVRGLSGSYGFIDLFWKGTLLAEHKSKGKDLGKAHSQAMDYIQDLQRTGRSTVNSITQSRRAIGPNLSHLIDVEWNSCSNSINS